MASEINTREGSAFFKQNLSFLGQSFDISLKYNSTDENWRISLATEEGTFLAEGLLGEGKSPTKKYSFTTLIGGNFWVFKKTNTDELLGFDNLGFGKDYGLFFLTTEEEVEYGL